MPFFARFKSKESSNKKTTPPLANNRPAQKPQWSDAWLRTRVDPEEVCQLLHECTQELKARALDIPFLLLPFRPSSDPSAARTFVRNFFFPAHDRDEMRGATLTNEIKMTEGMVLASVMKWCWSRLPGGIVTWEAYEMFRIGERDSNFARDAFTTFIPISVESDARVQIIRDFFDLLAAIAAHGKSNGLGGRKLSRYAGWWAFQHFDTGKGFDAGYKSWASAANATSHLFFAYLRSLSPQSPRGTNGILGLPLSLQQLVEATEYPPHNPHIDNETTKVVMIVDVVSPTPYALLRRAKNFEYRDDDRALQRFSEYADPVDALTDECRRVLRSISSTNQSTVSSAKASTSLVDPSWSRFEDIGFSSTIEESEGEDETGLMPLKRVGNKALDTSPQSQTTEWNANRPTTPSWADFLSSGFTDENGNTIPAPAFLPPDKMLPPINVTPRGQSSQSHRRNLNKQAKLEPGELASINRIEIDDAFWWVWISSLAGEEPTSRKAVFGRCALIETVLEDGRWMVMEEQVKGAAPEPVAGAYIAEKKGFLGFTTKRGRLTRRRSAIKKGQMPESPYQKADFEPSQTTLAPDQQKKIKLAAAELSRRNQVQTASTNGVRRGRTEEYSPSKTNSVFTLGPLIKDEASPAMKWAKQYDKNAIRAQYLGDSFAGKGSSAEFLTLPSNGIGNRNGSASTLSVKKEQELPKVPSKDPIVETAPAPPTPVVARAVSPLPPSIARPPSPPATVVEPALVSAPSSSNMAEVAAAAAVTALPVASPQPQEAARSIKKPAPAPAAAAYKKTSESPSPERTKTKSSPSPPPGPRSSGIRRLFGTMRSKGRDSAAPAPPDSPVETNPAIAAARRALEGKPNPSDRSTSPVPNADRFAKLRNVQKPAAAVQRTDLHPTREYTPPPSDKHATPEPVEEASTVSEADHEGPPRTRRDSEYDKLSRVDTNEREHADREFSTFDQGPLLEQPAFTPSESPSLPGQWPEEEPTPPVVHNPVPAATKIRTASLENGEHPDLAAPASPTDRWAQIRKNAAERAARHSEDQGRRSRTDTRTDDGETSGEETIESRVARIKARVAELTGNMESARR